MKTTANVSPRPTPETMRLNKFLAERTGVSRREADELIQKGLVTVNGQVATLGARIDKNDKVCYNKKTIPFAAEYIYLAMHKPVGYVCSRRAQGDSPTIYALLPPAYQSLKTVGRLDKDSSGLILLTNDGDFAFKMTHPKFKKAKIYEVELDRPLQPLHQQMISDYGVMLPDGPSRFLVVRADTPASNGAAPTSNSATPTSNSATPTSNNATPASNSATPARYIVELSEGRNRQIRRTFAAVGYTVTKLHRTNFGKYELSGLKPGNYVTIKV